MTDPNKRYTVENLVGKRTIKGVEQFLVKWKNYGHDQNTWEPGAGLGNNLTDKFDKILLRTTKNKKNDGANSPLSRSRRANNSPQSKILKFATLDVAHGEESPAGFGGGLEPKRVLSAAEADKQVLFLVEWYVLFSIDDYEYQSSEIGNANLN